MVDATSQVGDTSHWRALLDSAGEGIWGVNLHGICTFVNRRALDAFGRSSEEIVGRNIHDLVHHHYPDGRSFPADECPLYDVFRKNQPCHTRRDTMFRKDGTAFEAEVSAQPVSIEDQVVGAVVTFRDISELYRQEAELQMAHEAADRRAAEMEALIESIPHAVYVAPIADGEVRLNRRARALSGPEFPSQLNTLERALHGESSTETTQTGGRWLQSVGAPIMMNGDLIGGVVVNTDVTRARLQDEALRRSEKLAAVGQLASSIAHEINNPLESITNLLYLIRHSSSIDEIQEYAGLAQSELTRVTQITLQTLRFHRQNSRPTEVNLEDLARSVMALYTGRLLVRSVRLEWRVLRAPEVVCLEGEVRQVLNNLIRNALDAMSTGGALSIRVHSQTEMRTGRKGVRMTIADGGEGIDPKIRAHLFEPFQTTKETTGTGLGLWVSKGIVEKHGGHLRMRSRRDGRMHGTVFSMWLPVRPSASLASQAAG